MNTVAPYLSRLDAEIAPCADSARLAQLLAKKAIYLARTGKVDQAEEIGERLRSTFKAKGRPQAYCWIWLASGVLGYFRTGSGANRADLERAHAVAESLGLDEAAQNAAAWLAHLCFVDWEFEAMSRWLRASGFADSPYPEAASRAALVLADAAQYVGIAELADTWYRRVRELALQIGDRALVVAMLENRAVVQLDRVWVAAAFADFDRDQVTRIDDQITSGLAYERATDSASLMFQTGVWRSRLLALQGKYGQALDLLDREDPAPAGREISIVASRHALRAWLAMKAGKPDKARDHYELAARRLADDLAVDDLAVCLHQLAQVSESLVRDGRAAGFADRASGLHAEYIARVERLRSAIPGVLR